MRGYESISRTLIETGTDRLFGVMGDANMRFVCSYRDAMPDSFVATAHEAGAVAMADGYSRLSGKVGVASITHGPGLTNAMTALTNAVRAHSRLVVLTGQTPGVRGHLQDLDLRAAADLAGAEYQRVVNAQTAAEDLARAMRATSVGNRPVLLDIPVDFVGQEVDWQEPATGFGPWRSPASAPSEESLNRVVDVVAASERPVILVGRGALAAGAREEIAALARLLHAPVGTTILARSYMDGVPLNLGVFGGQANSIAMRTIGEADCIIVIGAGLNEHTTAKGGLLRGKAVVQCDLWPDVPGATERITAPVVSDARVFAQLLADAIGERAESAWAKKLAADLSVFDPSDDFTDTSSDQFVDLRTAMATLNRVLPADRALITDAGHFMTAPWRHLDASPGAYTHSGSFGAIGLGLGVATGAAFVDRDRPTVAVCGDGGLMMAIQELTVAVQHQLPLIVAVANDNSYGSEYHKLAEYGQDPRYALLKWPSFAEVARGFGMEGEVIRSAADIEALAPRLSDVRAPILLDIRTDPTIDYRVYR